MSTTFARRRICCHVFTTTITHSFQSLRRRVHNDGRESAKGHIHTNAAATKISATKGPRVYPNIVILYFLVDAAPRSPLHITLRSRPRRTPHAPMNDCSLPPAFEGRSESSLPSSIVR
ncbi:hypothetical protein D9611_011237 [Ephemerocybe angulata]|uniref:Uncharacterized protein n=1 Tax=Ephemerocybe angulata TaxID=980116 RepID=A0A8H5FJI2_9AGAR|nr:hypothetical protein D9611_011237 [Tulosesus angulatus]